MNRFLGMLLLVVFVTALSAQAPTGEIAGTVYDPSGGVVPNASIKVKNAATAFERVLLSNHNGQYSVPSLAAGTYEMRVEAPGFHGYSVKAVVATGGITTVDPHLQVGEQKDTVTVETINPQLEVEGHTIDQVISRQQIQQLPLNGRSFLQLAFLSPGVAISANYQGDYNRAMDVSILGGDPDRTRIAVDGARVNDSVDGGTQQNFSQEIVQEFQISSVNFDLSTGITAAGAINIVTRSGSNNFHGSGFFFFRDHHMAAYPGLQRDALASDPFFARRQSGLWVGGPVVKDRLFFFAAYEHNNQRGVFTSVPTDAAFSSLARVTPSPKHDDLVNARIDYRISAAHTAFVRYSHDGNNTFAPREINSMPSAWVTNKNWADSGVFSLISSLRPTLVNEFRYSNTFWSNHNNPPTADECPGCLGLGGPHVLVEGAGVAFGNQTNSPQSRLTRRNIFADNLTWQHGTHRFKFGAEIEFLKGTGTYVLDAPAAITLFSPQEVRQLAPPLTALIPKTFNTLTDVLSLPLKNFVFGIGDINQPPTFQRSQADHDRLFHRLLAGHLEAAPAPCDQLWTRLVVRKQRAQPRPHQAAVPRAHLRRKRPGPREARLPALHPCRRFRLEPGRPHGDSRRRRHLLRHAQYRNPAGGARLPGAARHGLSPAARLHRSQSDPRHPRAARRNAARSARPHALLRQHPYRHPAAGARRAPSSSSTSTPTTRISRCATSTFSRPPAISSWTISFPRKRNT